MIARYINVRVLKLPLDEDIPTSVAHPARTSKIMAEGIIALSF